MSLVIRKNLFPSPLFSHYQKGYEADTDIEVADGVITVNGTSTSKSYARWTIRGLEPGARMVFRCRCEPVGQWPQSGGARLAVPDRLESALGRRHRAADRGWRCAQRVQRAGRWRGRREVQRHERHPVQRAPPRSQIHVRPVAAVLLPRHHAGSTLRIEPKGRPILTELIVAIVTSVIGSGGLWAFLQWWLDRRRQTVRRDELAEVVEQRVGGQSHDQGHQREARPGLRPYAAAGRVEPPA